VGYVYGCGWVGGAGVGVTGCITVVQMTNVCHVGSQQAQQGELMGMPPTGKAIAITGMVLRRIKDGKAVKRTQYSTISEERYENQHAASTDS